MLPAIRKDTVFDAPIEKVWAAISTSEKIAYWFMDNDFQPIESHVFHMQSPFGPTSCKVLTVNPPHQLSFTWDEDGWVVTIELKEVDGKTAFTLIHDGWKNPDDLVPKANQKQETIWKTMSEGWDAIIESRLRRVIED